jgi:REP element-mobilizing transposase RayT
VCTWRRENLFGEVVDRNVRLNEKGHIVEECWNGIPEHFPQIELEAFVVMPNHIHGIIVIVGNDVVVGATHASPLRRKSVPTPKSLGAMVGSFKSAAARKIHVEFGETGIWQRNYYERVIRDEKEWDLIRRYIETNPDNWEQDEENPARVIVRPEQ